MQEMRDVMRRRITTQNHYENLTEFSRDIQNQLDAQNDYIWAPHPWTACE
jgi:hypothetical protein